MKMERFYANMKRFYGVVGIGLGYVGLIFLLMYGFLMYKENNQMVARGIFLEVIEEESMPIQKKMFIYFDTDKSPNNISLDEKIDWCAQDILMNEDPYRIQLDSLFRVRLSESGLPFETLVFGVNRTVAEKKPFSLFLQHATALEPVVFRKDHGKVSDIVLQGYIRISFGDFVRHSGWTVFLLGLLVVIPVGLMLYGVRSWIKRKTVPAVLPETALPSELEEEQPKAVSMNPQTVVLPNGICYDETLQKVWSEQGSQSVLLAGQKGELFSKLVKSNDYVATYEQLYGKGYKVAEKAAKQSIQTAIARLKEALKPILGIDIVSITGVGYKLEFHSILPESDDWSGQN